MTFIAHCLTFVGWIATVALGVTMSTAVPTIGSQPDRSLPATVGLLSRGERTLWHLGAVASLALLSRVPVLFANDSYQYLSVAENLLNGRGLTTSIVHFDAQYAAARIPAPQTTFGTGYSMVVAAVNRLGLTLPSAALLVSALSFVLTLTALLWAAPALGLGVRATRAAALLMIGSSPLRLLAWSLLSESLFTCLVTFAVGALAWSGRQSRGSNAAAWMLLAFALAGLSAWVRYAGYFVIAGMAVHALWRARHGPPALRWATAAGLGVSGALAGTLMLRNVHLVGNLRGGNEKSVHHSLGEIGRSLAQSFGELVAGDPRLAKPGFAVLLLGAATLALLVRRRPIPSTKDLLPAATVWIVYAVLMFYAGLTTVISFGARMYCPTLPLAFLLVAGLGQAFLGGFDRAEHRQAAMAVVGIGLGVLTVEHAVHSIRTVHPAPHAKLAERLVPIRDWLATHGPSGGTIVAPNQATAYELDRPVLSMVESEYSGQQWTEAHVHEIMDRYEADYLIVYPGLDPRDAMAQAESPFLAELCRGQAPEWLQAEVQSPRAILYHRL